VQIIEREGSERRPRLSTPDPNYNGDHYGRSGIDATIEEVTVIRKTSSESGVYQDDKTSHGVHRAASGQYRQSSGQSTRMEGNASETWINWYNEGTTTPEWVWAKEGAKHTRVFQSSSQQREVEGSYGPGGGTERVLTDHNQSHAFIGEQRDERYRYAGDPAGEVTYESHTSYTEQLHANEPTVGRKTGTFQSYSTSWDDDPYTLSTGETPSPILEGPLDTVGEQPETSKNSTIKLLGGSGGGVNPFDPGRATIEQSTLDDPLWQVIGDVDQVPDNSLDYNNGDAVGRLIEKQTREAADAEPGYVDRYSGRLKENVSGIARDLNPVNTPGDLRDAWNELPSDLEKAKALWNDPLGYLAERWRVIKQGAKDLVSTPEGHADLTTLAASALLAKKAQGRFGQTHKTGVKPVGEVPTALSGTVGTFDDLVRQAKQQYPKLAGKIHQHHITPQYLGGAVNGPKVPLDAAYHQQITNAFRKAWPYGQDPPSPSQLREIMNKVYSEFPLPPDTSH
jgi:hypothetical protein